MLTIGIVFVLMMASLILQKYLKFPSSIWLMVLGFTLIQLFPQFKVFENIDPVNFSNTLLAMLPFLLMADVLELKIKILKENLISIGLLAVVGVILSIGIGYLIAPWIFSGHNLNEGEIIFTLVSCFATDPVAVISIFNMFILPYALKTIVEGESLGNDGTAIIFAVYLGLPLMTVGSSLTAMGFALNSILVILGSITVGVLIAFLGFLMLYMQRNSTWQTMVWLAVSLSSFAISEYFYVIINTLFGGHSHFHMSGIVSVIVAGISMLLFIMRGQAFLERKQLKEERLISELGSSDNSINNKTINRVISLLEETVARKNAIDIVKNNFLFIALGANAFLFIYLGELIYVNLDNMLTHWVIILKMVFATLAIRAMLMGAFAWISNKCDRLMNIPFHWWFVLTFVGFQGGLSVVLGSMIPTETPNYDVMMAVILGNIVVSTFINATALIIFITINKKLFKDEYKREKALEERETSIAIEREKAKEVIA